MAHAELSVGMQTEGVDIRSVGNTQVGGQHEPLVVASGLLKLKCYSLVVRCEA